jgi:hypothetical protein
MEAQARSRAGRDLCFTFSVFEASVVVEGKDPDDFQSPFLARKGDGYVKDTDHHVLRRKGLRESGRSQ